MSAPAEPSALRLYNTLTRQVEPVEPVAPGTLALYSCGPTVYSFAHIGNFRTFLTADLIARTARALGLEVRYVSNITDVGHLTEDDFADAGGEDRMAKALEREGDRFANIYDLARFYTGHLLQDWHTLGLVDPDVRPRATEHVTEQIEAVERLVEAGHAYRTEQGVYFSVESFPAYGRLSGNTDADRLEGDRDVVRDDGKRDPRDFALWKTDDKHLMQWYSPFGRGFPGWHLECSVMAMRYLGETIDIHAGGEDLIFPHHECEIAQSESLTGQPFARHWVHTRFLLVEGERMAKSKGNFFTVRDLVAPEHEGGRGIDPLALRLALLSGKYREPLNFTFQDLKTAAKHRRRFVEAQEQVEAARDPARDGRGAEGDDHLGPRLEANYRAILEAMCDDLNTPVALREALRGVKLIAGFGDLPSGAAESAARWLERVNDLLGFIHADAAPTAGPGDAAGDPFAEQVEALIRQRADARKARDFARADRLRDEITALGVEIMDSPEGTTWRRAL